MRKGWASPQEVKDRKDDQTNYCADYPSLRRMHQGMPQIAHLTSLTNRAAIVR